MTGRGIAGRRRARLVLIAALALDALVAFLFVSAPGTMGPLRVEPPSPLEWVLLPFGVLLNIAGLAWMVWILRADPEGGPSAWRAIRDG